MAQTEATIKRTVQGIMQDQVSLLSLSMPAIPRQFNGPCPVANGLVVIRGETNFVDHPWVIYDGQFGRWQAPVKGNWLVRTPYRVVQ